MQTETSAQNLIYTGRYPFQSFGSQTDRHYPRPDPNRIPSPTNGPNAKTKHMFCISMRSLTKYTGSQEENYYLITLPTIIDRPTTIQVLGTTMAHLDDSITGFKTVYVSTPIVKQSGFHFVNSNDESVTKADAIMGILRIPDMANLGSVFTIATTQVIFRAEIKDQGYARLVGIPVQFLNNRGEALSLEGDIDLDGELIFQIECDRYSVSSQKPSGS